MLSTPGIGSGLDVTGIIDKLMTIEKEPWVKLGADQVDLKAQISGFGKLKSTMATFSTAMDNLSDATKFTIFKGTPSDSKILTATAGSTAAEGSYKVDVLRTAEVHRQAATTVFADTTTAFGSVGDKMKIQVGDNAFVVDIGDKSLADIRTAINAASDNTGVTASILHDDLGYHLTLTAKGTGSDNFIAPVAYTNNGVALADPFQLQSLNLDRDSVTGFSADDLDAVMTFENTFTVTSSSNTVSDVIDGITLNLVSAGTSTVEVARDDAKIGDSVKEFVTAYNDVVKQMDELRGGVLKDERSSLLSLSAQFRGIFNSAAGTSDKFGFLSEIGVTTTRTGTLEFDSSVFEGALTSDPAGIADLFANPTSGLAVRMGKLADSLLAADGLFSNRENSLSTRLDDVGDDRADLEFRLEQKEAALVKQYAALDALVAQLTTVNDFLTTQLASIATINQSSNR